MSNLKPILLFNKKDFLKFRKEYSNPAVQALIKEGRQLEVNITASLEKSKDSNIITRQLLKRQRVKDEQRFQSILQCLEVGYLHQFNPALIDQMGFTEDEKSVFGLVPLLDNQSLLARRKMLKAVFPSYEFKSYTVKISATALVDTSPEFDVDDKRDIPEKKPAPTALVDTAPEFDVDNTKGISEEKPAPKTDLKGKQKVRDEFKPFMSTQTTTVTKMSTQMARREQTQYIQQQMQSVGTSAQAQRSSQSAQRQQVRAVLNLTEKGTPEVTEDFGNTNLAFIMAKRCDLVLVSEKINPELAEEGKIYLNKMDGTYVSRFKNTVYEGSIIIGPFSNRTINLKDLEKKIFNEDFKNRIIDIVSIRGHAEAKTKYIDRIHPSLVTSSTQVLDTFIVLEFFKQLQERSGQVYYDKSLACLYISDEPIESRLSATEDHLSQLNSQQKTGRNGTYNSAFALSPRTAAEVIPVEKSGIAGIFQELQTFIFSIKDLPTQEQIERINIKFTTNGYYTQNRATEMYRVIMSTVALYYHRTSPSGHGNLVLSHEMDRYAQLEDINFTPEETFISGFPKSVIQPLFHPHFALGPQCIFDEATLGMEGQATVNIVNPPKFNEISNEDLRNFLTWRESEASTSLGDYYDFGKINTFINANKDCVRFFQNTVLDFERDINKYQAFPAAEIFSYRWHVFSKQYENSLFLFSSLKEITQSLFFCYGLLGPSHVSYNYGPDFFKDLQAVDKLIASNDLFGKFCRKMLANTINDNISYPFDDALKILIGFYHNFSAEKNPAFTQFIQRIIDSKDACNIKMLLRLVKLSANLQPRATTAFLSDTRSLQIILSLDTTKFSIFSEYFLSTNFQYAYLHPSMRIADEVLNEIISGDKLNSTLDFNQALCQDASDVSGKSIFTRFNEYFNNIEIKKISSDAHLQEYRIRAIKGIFCRYLSVIFNYKHEVISLAQFNQTWNEAEVLINNLIDAKKSWKEIFACLEEKYLSLLVAPNLNQKDIQLLIKEDRKDAASIDILRSTVKDQGALIFLDQNHQNHQVAKHDIILADIFLSHPYWMTSSELNVTSLFAWMEDKIIAVINAPAVGKDKYSRFSKLAELLNLGTDSELTIAKLILLANHLKLYPNENKTIGFSYKNEQIAESPIADIVIAVLDIALENRESNNPVISNIYTKITSQFDEHRHNLNKIADLLKTFKQTHGANILTDTQLLDEWLALLSVHYYASSKEKEWIRPDQLLALRNHILSNGASKIAAGTGKTIIEHMSSLTFAAAGKKVTVAKPSSYLASRDSAKLAVLAKPIDLTVGYFEDTGAYEADIVYVEFKRDIIYDYQAKIHQSGPRFIKKLNVDGSTSKGAPRENDVLILDEADVYPKLIESHKSQLAVPDSDPLFTEKMSALFYLLSETIQDLNITTDALSPNKAALQQEIKDRVKVKIKEWKQEKNRERNSALRLESIEASELVALFDTFTEAEISTSIRSALQANYLFEQQVQFTVLEGEILIVDAGTNDVLSSSSTWGYGLSQMIAANLLLQGKSDVKMPAVSRIIMEADPAGYLAQFPHIVPLTATPGDQHQQQRWKEVFAKDDLGFADYSVFHENKRVEHRIKMCDSHADIDQAVADLITTTLSTSQLEPKAPKKVNFLILCQTPKRAAEFKKFMDSQKDEDYSIQIYTGTDVKQISDLELNERRLTRFIDLAKKENTISIGDMNLARGVNTRGITHVMVLLDAPEIDVDDAYIEQAVSRGGRNQEAADTFVFTTREMCEKLKLFPRLPTQPASEVKSEEEDLPPLYEAFVAPSSDKKIKTLHEAYLHSVTENTLKQLDVSRVNQSYQFLVSACQTELYHHQAPQEKISTFLAKLSAILDSGQFAEGNSDVQQHLLAVLFAPIFMEKTDVNTEQGWLEWGWSSAKKLLGHSPEKSEKPEISPDYIQMVVERVYAQFTAKKAELEKGKLRQAKNQVEENSGKLYLQGDRTLQLALQWVLPCDAKIEVLAPEYSSLSQVSKIEIAQIKEDDLRAALESLNKDASLLYDADWWHKPENCFQNFTDGVLVPTKYLTRQQLGTLRDLTRNINTNDTANAEQLIAATKNIIQLYHNACEEIKRTPAATPDIAAGAPVPRPGEQTQEFLKAVCAYKTKFTASPSLGRKTVGILSCLLTGLVDGLRLVTGQLKPKAWVSHLHATWNSVVLKPEERAMQVAAECLAEKLRPPPYSAARLT